MKISDINEISLEDAQYAARYFIDYYTEVDGDISAYMRRNKLASIPENNSLPGMGPEEELFNELMSPADMEFTIDEVPMKKFTYYTNLVSSFCNEQNVPGKLLTLMVREKNSGKIIGFIRLGSPFLNSKPRNDWLGQNLDTHNLEMMQRFNQSVMMGFVIVPVQPFGFNALGGKLLAGICCSHEVREMMNKKYGINICAFETTSLYGSSKTASQYDGMKPFLRYTGLTMSNFTPTISGYRYQEIHDWFRDKIGGRLCDGKDSNKKLKEQTRMVRIMNRSLGDDPLRIELASALAGAADMQEQKRAYVSNYGHSNVPDYLTMKTDELNTSDNYERYHLEHIIAWWKKKATKRYDNLKQDGRLRTKLETWSINPDEIDIIR